MYPPEIYNTAIYNRIEHLPGTFANAEPVQSTNILHMQMVCNFQNALRASIATTIIHLTDPNWRGQKKTDETNQRRRRRLFHDGKTR